MRRVADSQAARAVLGSGDLQLARWPRQGTVDLSSGRARAFFELRGEAGYARVMMSARRQSSAQAKWEDLQEDEEEVASGWRYYWSRPWELKRSIVDKFRSLRGVKQDDEEAELEWDVDALVFLPNGDVRSPEVLLGSPWALPDYECMCARRDAESKDEASRQRLYRVLAMASAGALIAAGLRFTKSVRVSKSFGFVKRSLLGHSEVAATLGKNVVVESSKGTFGARYISGRLRLAGDSGAAEVDIAAVRHGGNSGPWRVSLARMMCGGRAFNLDRSQF